MANSEIERPVRPSVLDRLIDDDHRSNVEPALTRSQSVRQFKTALRRDLEWLLNARRTITPVPEDSEQLARSVFTFGLPDITSMSKDSRESFEKLARMIEKGILLNTGVTDYQTWWLPNVRARRTLCFSTGVLAILVVVTVLGALLRCRRNEA